MKTKLSAIICVIVCSIGTIVMFNRNKGTDNLLFFENIEAIAQGEGAEYPAGYNWSNDIDCPGWFSGSYHVCEENGPGEPCTDPGAKTCQCGKKLLEINDPF